MTRIEAGGKPDASPANRTRAQGIKLEDVFAICAALNVSPVHMLAPYDDQTRVRIVPEVRPSLPGMVRSWIAGRMTLPREHETNADRAEWVSEFPPEDLLVLSLVAEQRPDEFPRLPVTEADLALAERLRSEQQKEEQ